MLNPNCSELVIRLPSDMSREEILEELKKIGIYEVDIKNWWSWGGSEEDRKFEGYLFDKDNPNSPDYEYHAYIELRDGRPYGINGYIISASQHCQHQLFPTLRKIEKHFNTEVESYDGGSTTPYEDWISQGEPKIDNYNEAHKAKRIKLLLELGLITELEATYELL